MKAGSGQDFFDNATGQLAGLLILFQHDEDFNSGSDIAAVPSFHWTKSLSVPCPCAETTDGFRCETASSCGKKTSSHYTVFARAIQTDFRRLTTVFLPLLSSDKIWYIPIKRRIESLHDRLPLLEETLMRLSHLRLACAICLLVLGAGCLPALADMDDTDSMRCGESIVFINDAKPEVLSKCGDPTATEERGSVWIYNFGPTDFVYYITFTEDVVLRIQVDGYGY
jgi:hypothetical protein